MLFELRQYTLWPGKQADFVKLMEEVIIPFQTSVGMDIRGSWVAEEDETQFIWIRAFESEEERVRLYAAVYDSDKWQNEVAPLLPDMMDREHMTITRMLPTPRSAMQ